jgi:CsoR family transcriptional regulator, copper-sensing transcriptional repressor
VPGVLSNTPGEYHKSMAETAAPARGYTAAKGSLIKRLRRIEGQVRGVQGMVEDDRWCPDILQQIAAITAALDKVAIGLAEGHVQHCMATGAEDPTRRQEMTRELMLALGRLVR